MKIRRCALFKKPRPEDMFFTHVRELARILLKLSISLRKKLK